MHDAPPPGTFVEMSAPASRLDISVDGDRVVASGDIDAHTCPDLATALSPLPGTDDVMLDVADVTFMDSSGLRVLISAHKDAEAAGRRLVIERPSTAVERILEVSGLLDHLNVSKAD